MATLEQQQFSEKYSGLINRSASAIGLVLICITSHDVMRRVRRGRGKNPRYEPGRPGSVESWMFGYLFQGRCWASNPSPHYPRGWPLGWVMQVITFPEEKMLVLRGPDATLYVRFLRWFMLLHTFTTFPILFPIHVIFSPGEPLTSMTRASISPLTATPKGRSLLWIHLIVLFWVSITWMITLVWVAIGLMRMRAASLIAAAENHTHQPKAQYRHPHPLYSFQPAVDPVMHTDDQYKGVRYKTVMVANIPGQLRNEQQLKEYFEYFLARKIAKPTIGINTSTQPNFINRCLSFFWNRLKKIPPDGSAHPDLMANSSEDGHTAASSGENKRSAIVERVTVVRRTPQLATLLERRQEVLRVLETAHIRLACKVLTAVAAFMKDQPRGVLTNSLRVHRRTQNPLLGTVKFWKNEVDVEDNAGGGEQGEENRMDLLVRTIGPFVKEFSSETWPLPPFPRTSLCKNSQPADSEQAAEEDVQNDSYQLGDHQGSEKHKTIWDALLSIPRSVLDPYQPLIQLNPLFREKTVPTIDYYTAKLHFLTSLITEARSLPLREFEPASTAFVTFETPKDARRVYIDWLRIMKLPYILEFVKDWVVNLGVWAFTIFWIFPVSLLVGLVSIQNISSVWPSLKRYLDRHQQQSEVLQSLVPTVLVSVLSILIPPLLKFIAKRGHTIVTRSTLHDLIMTRYYKFLVVNLVVFFCIGSSALQSIKNYTDGSVISIAAKSFPSAAPFYVGWLIFTLAIHCGFSLAQFELPSMLAHLITMRQVTPRKRSIGIRPKLFHYYYWLPNHILVIHILLLFSTLNPLVIPLGLLYFSVSTIVFKNSLLRVYAKRYEGGGQLLLIRIIRYSLDGLIFSQVVFLAYMAVNKYTVSVVFAGIFVACTFVIKISFTRWCRTRFEIDDIREATAYCGIGGPEARSAEAAKNGNRRRQAEGRDKQEQETTLLSHERHQNQSAPPAPPPPRPQAMSTVDNRLTLGMLPIVLEGPVRTKAMRSMSSLGGGNTEDGGHQTNGQELGPERERKEDDGLSSSPRVTINPRHPPWDDNSLPDQPYQNPYYVLPIKDTLWLPMNPIGTLDLDMTVTMTVALTSEPGSGRLGPLTEMGTTIGPAPPGLSADLESATFLSSDEVSINGPTLDGTEEIELTPTIASRVQNLRSDGGVSTTNQQSDLLQTARHRPRTSGSATSQSKRPGPDLPAGTITRLPLGSPPQDSPSVVPTSADNVLSVSPSLLTELLRPIPVSSSPLLRTADGQHSFLPLPPPASSSRLTRPPTIGQASVQRVAIQEALNEEVEALQQSHTHLQQEAERQAATRSRWISWAIKNRE